MAMPVTFWFEEEDVGDGEEEDVAEDMVAANLVQLSFCSLSGTPIAIVPHSPRNSKDSKVRMNVYKRSSGFVGKVLVDCTPRTLQQDDPHKVDV